MSLKKPTTVESETVLEEVPIVLEEKVVEVKKTKDSKEVTKLKKTVLNLEKEVLELKEKMSNSIESFKKEMLLDMIMMREGYMRILRLLSLKKEKEFTKASHLKQIAGILDEFEAILYNHNVEMGKTDPKKLIKFHTKSHQVIETIDTKEEKMNGMVAESLGNSYSYKDKMLYKEKVNVYKYSKGDKVNE